MSAKNINESLLSAIEAHNLEFVQSSLENGADANYISSKPEHGTDHEHQPTTPLRMVMFCISDALLEEDDLKEFAEIAKLLLKYGADPKPAMEFAELRYGKFDPDAEKNPFTDVWKILANAQ